jgi:ribosomal protein S18 acetylase RimI-like enzyme
VQVRRAVLEDAPAIAAIHVAAWQAAYRGLMAEEVLDWLSVASREARWRRILSIQDSTSRVWVAVDGDAVLGFASTAPSVDDDASPGTAELYTLYLAPPWMRQGVGSMLLAHAVGDLGARGFALVTLWVLAENRRARDFFERASWSADGREQTDEMGFQVRYARSLA